MAIPHYCSASINFGNPIRVDKSKLKPVKKSSEPSSLDYHKKVDTWLTSDFFKKVKEAREYAYYNPCEVLRTDGRASVNKPCTAATQFK